jgi:magnesium chelatase subunit D
MRDALVETTSGRSLGERDNYAVMTRSASDLGFPFSAIVGQTAMKRALVLAAIHPGLGGVLIRGTKGTAKSTAVRALAALLPEIEVYEGDPFARAPGEEVEGWPLAAESRLVRRPVAIVDLPVGATDDRVVGSLNLERALATGTRAFEPGLLAQAHRGILYIDEVNLLGDHLVDVLLDAAAMGVNHVEREGMAFQHPARFVLIGTMNPEEGDLRPQLLDRFGLAVDIEPITNPAWRAEVVRRRLAFEADPPGFRARWAGADRQEGERIVRARALLPQVIVPEPVLEALCARCAREGADGLRADLTIYKAASALAAYEGRTRVSEEDVEAVAELALAHRRTAPPQDPSPRPPTGSPERDHDTEGSPRDHREQPVPDEGRNRGPMYAEHPDLSSADEQPDPARLFAPDDPGLVRDWSARTAGGRRRTEPGARGRAQAIDRRGAYVRAAAPSGPASDPALDATLRAAAPWQQARGRSDGTPLILRPADLRVKVRACPARHLILFVVDASRSMGARARMSQTKAAVLSLLIDAYQKRDRVGLITFGGTDARLVLPPTRSVRSASRFLTGLPVGGTTPLAAGLALAASVVKNAQRRDSAITPLVVLLTDGRANVPRVFGRDPRAESIEQARSLGSAAVSGLVIDTETGPVRMGLAGQIATAWGAPLKRLEDLQGTKLPEAVRRALRLPRAS